MQCDHRTYRKGSSPTYDDRFRLILGRGCDGRDHFLVVLIDSSTDLTRQSISLVIYRRQYLKFRQCRLKINMSETRLSAFQREAIPVCIAAVYRVHVMCTLR